MTAQTSTRRKPSLLRRIFGVFLVVAGLLVALVGGWGDGYLTTPKGDLTTTTNAMVTREIDTGRRLPDDPNPDFGELATVRIRAIPADPAEAVFVGIATRDAVQRYLAGTSYDEMATYAETPFSVTFDRHDGAEQPAPPAAQDFWIARASGTGEQTLTWDKTKGEFMAVIMNADASPGVRVSADIGLKFGWLVPLGLAIAAIGALLLLWRRPARHLAAPAPKRSTVFAR